MGQAGRRKMGCEWKTFPEGAPGGEEHPWFAVRVRSNFEHTTHRLLTQKGLTSFLPCYATRRRWSDRVKVIERPLFPGYVFCRFDPRDWLPVVRTPGVVQILGNEKSFTPIDESEMESVRRLVASGIPPMAHVFLRMGQRVYIERGPLRGVEGILVADKGGFRLVVSITLLQRSVAVEVDAEWVRPVANARYEMPLRATA